MSIGSAIRGTCIGHLDLTEFLAVDESAPVREVLEAMRDQNRTTTLVLREQELRGIFTERDVLRKVALRGEVLDRAVGELMTPSPVVVRADDTLLRAIRCMNEGHFRDLPVVDETGRVLGNLTDNAIVRHLADHLQAEVLNLPPEPGQVPATEEGA